MNAPCQLKETAMEMSEQWKAGFYHHFISRSISMLNKESAAHQVDTLSRLQTNQYGNPSTSQQFYCLEWTCTCGTHVVVANVLLASKHKVIYMTPFDDCHR
jgi:hypothetical protein